MLLLDFSKAFDTVPHKRLLKKLDHYGIRGQLIKWIESWLCGRTQTVVVNGSQSSPVTVTSGVPQGTVLSFRTLCWGAYIWRGLYMEGLIFGILRYFSQKERQTRNYHPLKFISAGCSTNIYKYSFFPDPLKNGTNFPKQLLKLPTQRPSSLP